ncbi:UNVERIFIED_ORG: hypothetical protein ABIC62_002432 [Burkholderia sp. 1595]|uniref:Uncharacterized protein n=1 Tax=Paraburkholderia terricola TaxID=169427 RepID=A0ABU1LSL1_9BURK|nr:hypothetical protein [Paraburkholderia terricola]MDR6409741.1 hypothetical protein [Paraburkholderia terricola]
MEHPIWSQPADALAVLISPVNGDARGEDDDARLIDGLLVQIDGGNGQRARTRSASFLRFGGATFWIDSCSGHALDHVTAWRRK